MTGDIGVLDSDGYLHITDRKKELFKTSGGKYIAPMRVEMAIARSPHISQVVLVGHGRPYPAALVSLNWASVRRELGIGDDAADATPTDRPDVRAFMRAQISHYTKDLAPFEQVRRFAILPRDLTMENGEISQTMKIKRRLVENKFAALVDKAYAEP
jgi:long-chain acyl-CoA synthetase